LYQGAAPHVKDMDKREAQVETLSQTSQLIQPTISEAERKLPLMKVLLFSSPKNA
jgi:hypothetical protein